MIHIKFIPIIILFFIINKINAQLGFCQGNSGDLIFIDTFGTGVNQSALPAGTTTYSFSNGMAPNDGFYTVNSDSNFFDWHRTNDHTSGDTNGNMLIINSDFTPGEFYNTTISGLCENTSYEFSSWLLNLSPLNGFCGSGVIPVNVRFEIWDNTNTNLLASGNTGEIKSTSTPIWSQYALVFQTLPAQTSVILKMINNGAGGCGNDIAIDDIVFKSCGDTIEVVDDSNATSNTICSSETPYDFNLTANPDNTVFNTHFYQWQQSTDSINWTDILGETSQKIALTGISQNMFYRTKVAEFAINLTNSDCITFSDIYQININQAPSKPQTQCWETATFNDSTCSWDVTGSQPEQPQTQCWETTTFNTSTCSWVTTGTQPQQPQTQCWETATFNTSTCSWDVTGSQPEQPQTQCWETTTFNTSTCSWVTTGTQPQQPQTQCWETATFNTSTCRWDVTGSQPEQPQTQCWETTTFNTSTCSWVTTGSQPEQPQTQCWETATFNTSTCSWDVTGSQPEQPETKCSEIATFNTSRCQWEITGTEPITLVEERELFCEGTPKLLHANTNIDNPMYLWNTGETTESITVNTPGTYTVDIKNDCFTTKKTIVLNISVIPIIDTITSEENTIIISTTNEGDFQYSLDGNSFQGIPEFTNITGGAYTVFVKDQNNCELVSEPFIHFVIPKFFTPNNDGINDTFNLNAIELFNTTEVFIFNRYGKLLKSSKNTAFSWDGTFNNKRLPASDYWYVIKINNQILKGHFALKR